MCRPHPWRFITAFGFLWDRHGSSQREFPIIPEGTHIPRAAIQSVVDQIVAGFHPQRIILFGAYAYGVPKPDFIYPAAPGPAAGMGRCVFEGNYHSREGGS